MSSGVNERMWNGMGQLMNYGMDRWINYWRERKKKNSHIHNCFLIIIHTENVVGIRQESVNQCVSREKRLKESVVRKKNDCVRPERMCKTR